MRPCWLLKWLCFQYALRFFFDIFTSARLSSFLTPVVFQERKPFVDQQRWNFNYLFKVRQTFCRPTNSGGSRPSHKVSVTWSKFPKLTKINKNHIFSGFLGLEFCLDPPVNKGGISTICSNGFLLHRIFWKVLETEQTCEPFT